MLDVFWFVVVSSSDETSMLQARFSEIAPRGLRKQLPLPRWWTRTGVQRVLRWRCKRNGSLSLAMCWVGRCSYT